LVKELNNDFSDMQNPVKITTINQYCVLVNQYNKIASNYSLICDSYKKLSDLKIIK
jgi:hypothetical protein